MIQPITSEAEWIRVLSSVPLWEPPRTRMLVISPHPDDETLGAGGLIRMQCLRGFDVLVAAVTDGEGAYDDFPGLREVREEEQTKALTHLGVSPTNVIRFALPDRYVASCEAELEERLAALVSPETHVVAPWVADFHPDHEACGRVAQRVASHMGAQLSFYFFWTWHFGKPPLLQELRLRSLKLAEDLSRSKLKALDCHRSQLFRDDAEPILPPHLLVPAARPFEIFAEYDV